MWHAVATGAQCTVCSRPLSYRQQSARNSCAFSTRLPPEIFFILFVFFFNFLVEFVTFFSWVFSFLFSVFVYFCPRSDLLHFSIFVGIEYRIKNPFSYSFFAFISISDLRQRKKYSNQKKRRKCSVFVFPQRVVFIYNGKANASIMSVRLSASVPVCVCGCKKRAIC